VKIVTLSLLMLSLPLPGFAQAPARPEGAAAQPQPAAQSATPKPAPPAPAATAEQPTDADNAKIVVPRDTLIPVVLLTTINTKSNFVGQAIFCKSIFPIAVGNQIIIPEGSSIRGTVTEVIRPGRLKGRAKLGLRFDDLTLPNGTTRRLRATLAGFGSAGDERFNPKEGQIEGSRSKKDSQGKLETTTSAGVDAGEIVGIENDHPVEGMGIGAGAGAAAGVVWILATRASDIVLPHGISLTVQLSQPITFDPAELEPPDREPVALPSPYDAGPIVPRRDQEPRN
jgi:type IV secretion system protein VirB10